MSNAGSPDFNVDYNSDAERQDQGNQPSATKYNDPNAQGSQSSTTGATQGAGEIDVDYNSDPDRQDQGNQPSATKYNG